MAQQTINIGTAPNDGTGTPLRTSFDYCNLNFTELYTAVGPSGNNIVVPGNATITGDLTVDTSTLKVDSTNNRVGIGTASPAETLTVAGKIRSVSSTFGLSDVIAETTASTGTGFARLIVKTADREWRLINDASTSGSPFIIYDATAAAESLKIATAGVYTFGDGAGGTRMTLNSTGLGVGGSPVNPITAYAASSAKAPALLLTTVGSPTYGWDFSVDGAVNGNLFIRRLVAGTKTDVLEFDRSNGNVGVGVTPSAWGTGGNIQLPAGAGNSGIFTSNRYAIFGSNAYNNAGWKYVASEAAAMYVQDTGSHAWFNAIGGTAGNPITDFATAKMTLDASGNLLVGKTTSGAFTDGCQFFPAGTLSLGHPNGTGSGAAYSIFAYDGVKTGDITQNGTTGVLYNTVSDYRLKESVQPLIGGLARVNSLKPSIYKWKSDGSAGEGFLAHELAEVVPTAVTGEKDAVNEDGSIKTQSVDLSRVVPILVAAIKELTARVQTLEAR